MELKIYSKSNVLKLTVSPSGASEQRKKLMGDNVLEVGFVHHECVLCDVGDYIDFQGERYTLGAAYRPDQKSTLEYEYNMTFAGIESEMSKALCFLLVDGEMDSDFALTDSPQSHLQLIVDNINRIKNTNVWKIGSVVADVNKVITYEGVDCLSALNMIAQTFETEWYIQGNTINLCKCELGDRVSLGYMQGATSVTAQADQNADFFTRLYVKGSTRNIVKSSYGSDNLHLPGSVRYLEKNTEYGVIEREVIFTDVYPRRVGAVSSVRSASQTIDGQTRQVYYFKDSGLTFNPNTYEIAGLTKHVIFESGELQGYDFECNWNNATKEFELINQYPDSDVQIPSGTMIPVIGDKYVLYNITMPQEYVPLAEAELLEKANEYMAKSQDATIYNMPLDPMYVEANRTPVALGQRIKIVSPQLFTTGYKDSRIIGYTRNINEPTIYTLEIGDIISIGRIENIERVVQSIIPKVDNAADKDEVAYDVSKLKTELERRLLKSDVLASTDAETVITEENVYSALRSLLEDQKRLRKDIPDTAEGLIKFMQGAHYGEYINSMAAGKGAGIDANGNAQFESVEVRGYMKVMELIINRLSAIESDYVFTDSGNCLAVEDLGERTYRLTMRKDYDFDFTSLKEDDIVYSIVNNLLSSGEYYTVWMRVLSVNINANTLTVVLFPDVECPTGKNFPPIPSINIARRGSVSDKMRQSCFYLSSSEGAIVFLDGVTKPILEEYNYQMILGKPKHLSIFDNLPINFDHTYLYVRGLIFQDSFHVRHNGVPVRSEVFRGEWSALVAASEDPYRYTTTEVHLVYHLGCKWSCYTDKTIEEPKWNATGWVMIEGNNNLSIEFVSSNGFSFVRGRVDTEVTPICKLGHIDISDDILAADWEWKRDSGLPVEDANWNIAHATNGRKLHLTNDDMPSNWSITNKVKFSCSAFVRVGSEIYKVENQIIA